jgi:hypothetical protein
LLEARSFRMSYNIIKTMKTTLLLISMLSATMLSAQSPGPLPLKKQK